VPHPFRSVVLDAVGSTNREAFTRAETGEAGPLWIVARRQTAGRGRSGRSWSSEPGNLYASLLIRLPCPPALVPQLSLVTGVAVVDAMSKAAGGRLEGLRLKWPNDVLIGQAKCVGILAESLAEREGVVAVIGIGINLAWHPVDLGREATNLKLHGIDVEPQAMLGHLDASMQHWLATWDCGAGFAAVRAAWLERAGPVGERCSVNAGGGSVEGTFAGLDAGGALIVRDGSGRERTVTFGDVSLAPVAQDARA
jgi:BirA family biotin operon repressor/biotin-[acetyl-CoA-carboxylase] ligase